MNDKEKTASENALHNSNLSCGLIMPISAIDGCSAEHWSEVKQIFQDAVESISNPKFSTKLVSDADDVGVIQKRIVQGVYNSDIIICDVSGKNSNVMFELGMRLAFDRPTVIVKDDKTDYSFDTSVVEHLAYPRDLRFSKIVNFKKQLADKVLATYNASKSDPEHSTFLKSFGTFKVAHLDQKEAPSEQIILDILQDMQKEMAFLRRGAARPVRFNKGILFDQNLIDAIAKMRLEKPDFLLDADEDLISHFIEHEGNLVKGYKSKADFREALQNAINYVLS